MFRIQAFMNTTIIFFPVTSFHQLPIPPDSGAWPGPFLAQNRLQCLAWPGSALADHSQASRPSQ